MRCSWVVVVLVFSGSCAFDGAVPAGADVRCDGASLCPQGETCDVSLGRCTTTRPDLARKIAITPLVGGRGTVFTATLEGSLQGTLKVLAPDGSAAGNFESVGGALTWTAPATATDGAFPVLFSGTDPSGPVNSARVVDLTLDLTAPSLGPTTLTLTPSPQNLLVNLGFAFAVERLGTGTVATLRTTASEPLSAPPRFSVSCGGQPFPSLVLSGDEAVVASGTLDSPGPLEAACVVSAHLVDAVGNEAEQVLDLHPPLFVDTIAPAAPPVDVERAVVLIRAPQGEVADAGPSFRVETRLDALAEPGVLVLSNTDGVPLARVLAHDLDAGVVSSSLLTRADPEEVLAQQVDLAGNASPPVVIREHDYLVLLPELSAEGDEPLRDHQVTVTVDWNEGALPAGQSLLLVPPADAGPMEWLYRLQGSYQRDYLTMPTSLPWRSGAAVAGRPYPQIEGFVFGGQLADGGLTNEVVRVTGQLAVVIDGGPVAPPPRTHAMLAIANTAGLYAFDQVIGSDLVLFGGRGADGGVLGDTWVLDQFSRWRQWVGAGPPAREDGLLMRRSPPTPLTLSTGRAADGRVLGDVWTFTPDGGWTQQGFTVPPRAAATWLDVSQGFSVAGGMGDDGGLLSDAWTVGPVATTPLTMSPGIPFARGVWNSSVGIDFAIGTVGNDGGSATLNGNAAQGPRSRDFSPPQLPFGYDTGLMSDAVPGDPVLFATALDCNEGCSPTSDAVALSNDRLTARPLVASLRATLPVSAARLFATPEGPTRLRASFFGAQTLRHLERYGPTGFTEIELAVDAGAHLQSPLAGWDPLTQSLLAMEGYNGALDLKPDGGGWRVGTALDAGQLLFMVTREQLSPLVVTLNGALYEYDAGAWVQRLAADAGVPNVTCAAWDEDRGALYLSTAWPNFATWRWKPDAGARLFPTTALSCPSVWDRGAHALRVPPTYAALEPAFGVAMVNFTPSVAGAHFDGGVASVRVELVAGASSEFPPSGGAALDGVTASAGGFVSANDASVGAPSSVAVEWVARGDASVISLPTLTAPVSVRSQGVNGAGTALVRAGGRVIFRLKK